MRSVKFFWMILLIFSYVSLNSQEWIWASNLNFEFTETSSNIGGVDKEGNVYLTLLNVSESKNQPGGAYRLLKLDKTGKIIWNKTINQYSQGRITTDLNGNTYVCYSDRLICFNSDGNQVWQIDSKGLRSFGKVYLAENFILVEGADFLNDSVKGLVAKYKYDGEYIGTTYFDIPRFSKCTVDQDANLVGVHDDYPDSVTKNQSRLVRFTSNGVIQLKREVPHHPNQIIIDKANNIYISAWHDIFPVRINGIEYKTPGNFIVKYAPTGELIWYKIIEGSVGNSKISCDQLGNLLLAIEYSESIKIDNDFQNTIGGQINFLLMKWDQQGNKLISWETPGIKGRISPQSIFCQNDDIYLSAWMTGEMQFDNTLVRTSSDMYSELFVGKISSKNLVGLSEANKADSMWQIFPNPSGDIFTLSGLVKEQTEITVCDVRGQLIKSQTIPQTGSSCSIDLSNCVNGVYFLQVKSEDKVETKKLVKN